MSKKITAAQFEFRRLLRFSDGVIPSEAVFQAGAKDLAWSAETLRVRSLGPLASRAPG